MKRFKQGFTIVEMLMVIAVLAVLVGIITTAASASIRQARSRRTEAMRLSLQAGVATYYAQKNEWPAPLESIAANFEESDSKVENGVRELTESEANNVFRRLVQDSLQNKGNPYLDVSGLFVATEGAGTGVDFREAVKKNRAHGAKTLSPSQMVFGYPQKATGRFKRFRLLFNGKTDTVTVRLQKDDE